MANLGGNGFSNLGHVEYPYDDEVKKFREKGRYTHPKKWEDLSGKCKTLWRKRWRKHKGLW